MTGEEAALSLPFLREFLSEIGIFTYSKRVDVKFIVITKVLVDTGSLLFCVEGVIM